MSSGNYLHRILDTSILSGRSMHRIKGDIVIAMFREESYSLMFPLSPKVSNFALPLIVYQATGIFNDNVSSCMLRKTGSLEMLI